MHVSAGKPVQEEGKVSVEYPVLYSGMVLNIVILQVLVCHLSDHREDGVLPLPKFHLQ